MFSRGQHKKTQQRNRTLSYSCVAIVMIIICWIIYVFGPSSFSEFWD